MRKAVIEIEAGSPYFRVLLQDGKICHSPKLLTPEEFGKLLGNIDPKLSVDVSPILAQQGCIRYVRLAKELERRDVSFFVVEKSRQDYNYAGQVFEDVGLPRMLFGFMTGSHRLVATYLVCIKDGIVGDDTPLYRYPFGNVGEYACWGDFGLVEADHPYKLRGLPHQFLALEHNDDLFSPSYNSMGLQQRTLLEYLQGRDFDDDLLVPLNVNFLDFCRRLKF